MHQTRYLQLECFFTREAVSVAALLSLVASHDSAGGAREPVEHCPLLYEDEVNLGAMK